MVESGRVGVVQDVDGPGLDDACPAALGFGPENFIRQTALDHPGRSIGVGEDSTATDELDRTELHRVVSARGRGLRLPPFPEVA